MAKKSTSAARSWKTESIVEVIREHVPLTTQPDTICLIGRCPFHDDKETSLTVMPSTGAFYCRGCGASGDEEGVLHMLAERRVETETPDTNERLVPFWERGACELSSDKLNVAQIRGDATSSIKREKNVSRTRR